MRGEAPGVSFRRRAGGGRRDTVEASIVEALEAYGVRVWRLGGTGNPDLLTLYRSRFLPLEVKGKTGTLTANQQDIPWPVVRTPEEALALFGVKT